MIMMMNGMFITVDSLFRLWIHLYVQKLGQMLADFVQTFRPAAKMVSIAGQWRLFKVYILYISVVYAVLSLTVRKNIGC